MQQTSQFQATSRRIPFGRLAVAAVAVGGLSASALLEGSAGASTRAGAKSVVVSTATSGKFGKILVSGKTLYTLKASKTPCTGACMKIWPALVLPKGTKKAAAGSGVSASKLGVVTLAGGMRQVTYEGKPLYLFSGDTSSGQVHGNVTDTWGKWSDVVLKKSATSGAGSGASTSGTGGTAF